MKKLNPYFITPVFLLAPAILLATNGAHASSARLSGTAAAALVHQYEQSVLGEMDWDALAQVMPSDDDQSEQGLGEQNGKTATANVELPELITKNATQAARLVIHVFKRPSGINVQREFFVATVDGKIRHIGLVSTADPNKTTKSGNSASTPNYQRSGSIEYRRRAPYPFHRSATYENSAMFWGIDVANGIWVHSTPHATHLGRPASMGCVRVSFPSAMELWNIAVNEVDERIYVAIHAPGSQDAIDTYKRLDIDRNYLKDQLDNDMADANRGLDSNGDYNGNVLHRRGHNLEIPRCGGKIDCFDYFGVKVQNLAKD